MDVPQWLTEDEQQAWRLLLRVTLTLVERLDGELREAHGLSLSDYEILAHLSSRPDHMLRMSALAERALVSKSRLTHTVDRLVARDLVRRQPCTEDRRGVSAVLTAKGLRLLEQAAPTHVDGVRRLLLGGLPRTGVRHLVQTLRPVADQLAESPTG